MANKKLCLLGKVMEFAALNRCATKLCKDKAKSQANALRRILRYALWHHAGFNILTTNIFILHVSLTIVHKYIYILHILFTHMCLYYVVIVHVIVLHGSLGSACLCLFNAYIAKNWILGSCAGARNRGTWGGLPVHEGSLAINHSHHLW